MDQTPLVMDEIEAGEAFVKQLSAYRPVKAAGWLRGAEDGERYLYIALEGLDDSNTDAAYAEVLRIARQMKDHYIDPFRVKLISPDDPIARAAMELYQRFPGRIPTRFNGSVFGDTAVAEAFVYPRP
jgi:hypothetical protein